MKFIASALIIALIAQCTPVRAEEGVCPGRTGRREECKTTVELTWLSKNDERRVSGKDFCDAKCGNPGDGQQNGTGTR